MHLLQGAPSGHGDHVRRKTAVSSSTPSLHFISPTISMAGTTITSIIFIKVIVVIDLIDIGHQRRHHYTISIATTTITTISIIKPHTSGSGSSDSSVIMCSTRFPIV